MFFSFLFLYFYLSFVFGTCNCELAINPYTRREEDHMNTQESEPPVHVEGQPANLDLYGKFK